MYLFENPVLQRELLVNLRTVQAFLLLLAYNLAAGAGGFSGLAATAAFGSDPGRMRPRHWSSILHRPIRARVADGAELRRRDDFRREGTQDLRNLLASPLRPRGSAGQAVRVARAAGDLIFSSLPIVMLCLRWGRVALRSARGVFGAAAVRRVVRMISVACSSYFMRTASALIVSYLLILPLALAAVWSWNALGASGEFRLYWTVTVLPVVAAAICVSLFYEKRPRGCYIRPTSAAKENDVIDLAQEKNGRGDGHPVRSIPGSIARARESERRCCPMAPIRCSTRNCGARSQSRDADAPPGLQ